MFRKDILAELAEPNDYYDRCYGCEKTGTDGWGDELCSPCKAEFNQTIQAVEQSSITL